MSDLLATKFTLPVTSRTAGTRVERARLTERLCQARGLVLVSAPAGFGKTTCVLAWLEAARRGPVGWLSLDPADDEPARFFLYLIAALRTGLPGFGRDLEGVLRAGQVPPAGVLAAVLGNEIQSADKEATLVIDDFHLLQDAFILDVLEQLINHLPENLTLALVSREDPPFSLGRLRANGLLSEVRADDLRFTRAETGDFLNHCLRLDLSPHEIEALEERTEGWAAGLQLAGLSLRGQPDPAAFIAALNGSQRFILPYLLEEVLNRQPEEVRAFLLETSLLERFNADLCQAVTGLPHARALLERLLQANLFLVPLDERGEWFRYHHLFADLLRDQLKAQAPQKAARLHRAAAAWFQVTGQPLEAVDHALAAGDFPAAADLLEAHALTLLFQGHSARVEAALRALPVDLRGQNPSALLALAWVYLLRADIQKALLYFGQLQPLLAALPDDALEPRLRAEWIALQAMFAAGQGQAEAGRLLAEKALQATPSNEPLVRTLVYMSLAAACQDLDDTPGAIAAQKEIIRLGCLADKFETEIMGYAGLCQILLNHGQYRGGFEAAARGVARLEEAGRFPPISAALYGSLAETYFQWGQTEKALEYYRRAGRLSELCGYSDGEICLRAVLSRQCLLNGDLAGAEAEIAAGLDLMRRQAPAWVREVALSQQVSVLLAGGRLAEAETAYREMAGEASADFRLPSFAEDQNLTPASGYIYLSALRILLVRARTEVNRDLLPAGIDLAGRVLEAAQRGDFTRFAIEALLARGQIHLLRGDPDDARADLTRAMQLGEKEELLLVFAEHARPLLALTSGGFPGVGAAYAARVRQAAAMPAVPQPLSQSTSLLTMREREVLALMCEGLTYADIAARLVVSLNTVRSHVKAIYGKLGTDNRTRAIALARDQGLLEP